MIQQTVSVGIKREMSAGLFSCTFILTFDCNAKKKQRKDYKLQDMSKLKKVSNVYYYYSS